MSGTGDGEKLITGVIAHAIAAVIEYKNCTLQNACDFIIKEKNKHMQRDLGVITVNADGDIGISFNSKRMHRGWVSTDSPVHLSIY
jgi:beta-aspartyl-peptidase (threonine type)